MGLFDMFFGGGGSYSRRGVSSQYRETLREMRKQKSKWYRIVRSVIIFAFVLSLTLFFLALFVSDLRHEWVFKTVFIVFALCAGGCVTLPWITEYERGRKRASKGEPQAPWRKWLVFVFLGFIGLCTLLWIIAVFVIGNGIEAIIEDIAGEGTEYDFGSTFTFLRVAIIFTIQAAVGSVIAISTMRYGKSYLALRIVMYVTVAYLDLWVSWFVGGVTIDGLLNGFAPVSNTLLWVLAVMTFVALLVASSIFGAQARRKEIELFMKGDVEALTSGDVDLIDANTANTANNDPFDLGGSAAPAAPVAPSAPQTAAVKDPETQLAKLKDLFDKGLITEEEYQAKRKDIIDKM